MYRVFSSFYVFLVLVFGCSVSLAQIENVRVERYYVSDANDATDTTGGGLPIGSVTYRIFVDLPKGQRIVKIYGDANHTLKFHSTADFFNNKSEGQSFGKDFNKSRLAENTVALDSWLTIGQTTKVAGKQHGTPKENDSDGSFIGGINNDGGSASIPGGLLVNADPSAGIPLTISDGNDTLTALQGSWFDYGILSINGDDSTIFGSLSTASSFICNGCGLQYSSGISGVHPDSNQVLVAQLTTTGDLSFEMNLEIVDSLGNLTKYVAQDNLLQAGEVFSRKLTYPFTPLCGCPDPRYIEFLADRDCDAIDSCKNLVVFGCMDSLACNFDPDANFNISSTCCYPGRCSDRDLALVCPQLTQQRDIIASLNISPNPVHNQLYLSPKNTDGSVVYEISEISGKPIFHTDFTSGDATTAVDVSFLARGVYVVRMFNNRQTTTELFIKQ